MQAILVTGDTKPLKDVLQALGGKWNKPLAGWIFQGPVFSPHHPAAAYWHLCQLAPAYSCASHTDRKCWPRSLRTLASVLHASEMRLATGFSDRLLCEQGARRSRYCVCCAQTRRTKYKRAPLGLLPRAKSQPMTSSSMIANRTKNVPVAPTCLKNGVVLSRPCPSW